MADGARTLKVRLSIRSALALVFGLALTVLLAGVDADTEGATA